MHCANYETLMSIRASAASARHTRSGLSSSAWYYLFRSLLALVPYLDGVAPALLALPLRWVCRSKYGYRSCPGQGGGARSGKLASYRILGLEYMR
jgi:hypothetical protein